MSGPNDRPQSDEWPLHGEEPLTVTVLEDRDDGRGSAFYLPAEAIDWLGGVREVHLVTARPGAIRGNHVHHRRREVILVRSRDPWRLAWRPPGGDIATRDFADPCGVLIAVEPGTAHAIRNTGDRELVVTSCASARFDPDDPDTERVELLG